MKRILWLSLFLCACHSEHAAHSPEPEIVNVDEIPDDIRIPIRLWDSIEGSPAKLEEKKSEGEDESLNKGSVLFSPVTVVLKENNEDVLNSPEIRIQLPRGGGKVDLSKYVTEQAGSFFVRFEWPEWADIGEIHSYYVSRARKRKLEGEVYGVGCNKYLDISSKVAHENKLKGIKVNTTRERHTTVLAGHFVFSAKKDNQTFLTQVTFSDSKNGHLLCEDTKAL